MNNKAIPRGFMTVGEVAKKMGVTVRALQYYDREGLLSPSAESEGGRRLYGDKDLVKLHQILSMKYLGFSLDEIKNRLISLDTPAEVADALAEQAAALREKLRAISETLTATEALRAEVLKMQTVDFKKYADIVVNLQMKNDYYWLIKHFDERTLDHLRTRFDKDSGTAMISTFNRLQDEALRLQKSGYAPDSAEAQALAREFWAMVTEFTEGNTDMLGRLTEIGRFEGADDGWREKQAIAIAYIEPALGVYFDRAGIDPFKEGKK